MLDWILGGEQEIKEGVGKCYAIVWAFQKDSPFTRIKIPKRDQAKAQEGLGIAMAHDLQLEED